MQNQLKYEIEITFNDGDIIYHDSNSNQLNIIKNELLEFDYDVENIIDFKVYTN